MTLAGDNGTLRARPSARFRKTPYQGKGSFLESRPSSRQTIYLGIPRPLRAGEAETAVTLARLAILSSHHREPQLSIMSHLASFRPLERGLGRNISGQWLAYPI